MVNHRIAKIAATLTTDTPNTQSVDATEAAQWYVILSGFLEAWNHVSVSPGGETINLLVVKACMVLVRET